ncbi:MAG: hypothetical protein ACRESJ_05440 [Pseudomonas sp.]|uniref:hypothetical protein n=1 Tax=Pseudomonas sp. TaxID=306 RepID=UPI003D6E03D2
MPTGSCKLCCVEGELQLSHFIPKFVGKWIKDTSATGFIRLNQSVNKRAQDTAKDYWLCRGCEQLFSGWEREFAKKIFYPVVNEGKSEAIYGDWLAKFCASLSWRTLTYIRNVSPDGHKGCEGVDEALDQAESALADYLLGRSNNLGKYEQHFYPLEAFSKTNVRNLPANINRYILRNMHMDILYGEKGVMVYTKLPYFIVLGLTGHSESTRMRSSRVALGGGKVSPREYWWPTGFAEYMFRKAREISGSYKSINPKQRKVIDSALKTNPERAANSKTIEAFNHDHKIFGDRAFFE